METVIEPLNVAPPVALADQWRDLLEQRRIAFKTYDTAARDLYQLTATSHVAEYDRDGFQKGNRVARDADYREYSERRNKAGEACVRLVKEQRHLAETMWEVGERELLAEEDTRCEERLQQIEAEKKRLNARLAQIRDSHPGTSSLTDQQTYYSLQREADLIGGDSARFVPNFVQRDAIREREREYADELDRRETEAKDRANKMALKWRQMPIACQDFLELALGAGPNGIPKT